MSGGSQREFKQKIRSTVALSKVFRAQELIASSRIAAARSKQAAALPYADAITQAVSALVVHNPWVDHPLIRPKPGKPRAAVLVLASDRGMAGSYTGGVIREAGGLLQRLSERVTHEEIDLYVAGRRAVNYYTYRNRDLMGSWIYGSDHPQDTDFVQIANTMLEAFNRPNSEGGVSEVYVVYTRFINLVSQEPRVTRMLPLEIVSEGLPISTETATANKSEYPLYEFEPSEKLVLDALLPRYVAARIRSFMLESAASEVASRQRAMHTAVDNSRSMVNKYTRLANAARQNDITAEITEIVSGADALAN